MAKSSRATTTKRNRTALRAKVFGPADLARTKRLSEKLAAIASAPKPPAEKTASKKDQEIAEDTVDAGAMDVDTETKGLSRKEEKRRKEAKSTRVEKKRRRKTRNTIGFEKKIVRK